MQLLGDLDCLINIEKSGTILYFVYEQKMVSLA
ncbi:hypothetical protein BXY57_2116 [Thermoflavifilum aggregans]|uniref:Uncharacterized protein n=1 Tax=Thermoflavifilum aggregans TaxID=454188 RepID=A0A2M9CX59_9BACT|nr:hypothetical protein BXY57_2116 [Thermoflavifilum aggregans]